MSYIKLEDMIEFLSNKLFTPDILNYLGVIILQLILALFLAKILLKLGNFLIERFFEDKEKDDRYIQQRHKTLRFVAKSAFRYTVYFMTGLIILEILNIPTASILAGAGVVGLAIGFGAQSLIRDIITGFFILFEKQFVIDDYVKVSGVEGIVEEIGLRVTKIKSFDGEINIIPNSNIDQVTNFSTNSKRVLVDAPIDYNNDIQQAIDILNELAEELRLKHEEVVEGPTVLGVQEIAESSINIRVMARVKPMDSWQFGRILRQKIKERFDQAGISIPYNHVTVVNRRD